MECVPKTKQSEIEGTESLFLDGLLVHLVSPLGVLWEVNLQLILIALNIGLQWIPNGSSY
jgi:hypothetical protein